VELTIRNCIFSTEAHQFMFLFCSVDVGILDMTFLMILLTFFTDSIAQLISWKSDAVCHTSVLQSPHLLANW
jgi:hypothetical protein